MNEHKPIPYVDIMIKFKENGKVITKRGFYSGFYNGYLVPVEYIEFEGMLIPHGFNNTVLSPEEVIEIIEL